MMRRRLEQMITSMEVEIDYMNTRLPEKEAEAEAVSYQDNPYHRGILDASIARMEARKQALEEQVEAIRGIIELDKQNA